MAERLEAALFGPDGSAKGTIALDPEVFGLAPNLPVMHQVVTAQLAAARSGTASTKTRSEVRGGGRKPWRQKGTGRARHGSIRSPIWTGGGVVFGPHPRHHGQRTPKKMKRLALRSALSARAAEGEVKVVERFEWSAPRTKTAVGLLRAMGVPGKVVVVVGSGDGSARKSFRNLDEVLAVEPGQLTTYDVLWAETVIFTEDTLAAASGAYEVSDEDFVKESGDSGGPDGPEAVEEGSAEPDRPARQKRGEEQ